MITTCFRFQVIIAFAALVCGNEGEDSEQKKRGAGKTSLNTIPTGAQKQDYTYSIYAQNPSPQSSGSASYQPQVSNSFYPSQANSQYYSAPVPQNEQSYGQPQINLLPPQSSSQFVPINFLPSPGYQSKYQFVPSKQNGNIQLALLQQSPNFPSQSLVQYPQSLFAPPPTSSIGPHQNLYNPIAPQGQYNVGPNLPLQFGNSYLGQPSTMLLLAQPNPSLYNNVLYQNQYSNPLQNLYNYLPQNSQTRYGQQVSYSTQPAPDSQVSLAQSLPKEDNDISTHSSDYTSAPSDTSSSYKTAYASSRSSYAKLR